MFVNHNRRPTLIFLGLVLLYAVPKKGHVHTQFECANQGNSYLQLDGSRDDSYGSSLGCHNLGGDYRNVGNGSDTRWNLKTLH